MLLGDDALIDVAIGDAADETDGPKADSGCWDTGAPGVDSAGHAAGVVKGSTSPSFADGCGIVVDLGFISEEEGAVPVPARPN